jgi:hypothetical protein
MPHQTTLLDITKVAGAAIGATTITIANINGILTTFSILLAISYTIWKWRKDYKNR